MLTHGREAHRIGSIAAPRLPVQVRTALAERQARLHHYLWHGSRGGWLTTFTDADRDAFRAIGWEPPRPARRFGPDGRLQTIFDNDSGEDFFFMHRRMIEMVNALLAEIGDPAYPRVQAWERVPAPDDEDYPVPPAFDVPGDPDTTAYIRSRKTPDFYESQMKPWEERYTSEDYLRSVSLGHFGAELEFTIHNALHIRFCESIAEMRPDPAPGDPQAIPEEWDASTYEWLGDTYSSHVNDVFWKLHGWVDDCADRWARANGVAAIDWKGTWEGPHGHPMPGHDHGVRPESVTPERVADLERVVAQVGRRIPSDFRDDGPVG